jgi:lysophospholipase L1-like esterase
VLFTQGQKILFIGDSITDANRRGGDGPYGNGYVSIVRSLLIARYPELRLRFANRGISGNTVRDLAARWQQDVLAEQPDWLAVMIGINDVWRAFGANVHESVPLPEYRETLSELLHRARAETGARLVLMEPYVIEPDRSEPMRSQMDRFGAVVAELAGQLDAVLVRTQTAFDRALQHSSSADWADDQIHPNAPGHAIIALAFLRSAGFEL